MPYWFGGAIVALVVMSYVFFGGMRGTAWVNTFQTILFLTFGVIAIVVIGVGMGGFRSAANAMLASPVLAPLLTRERISPLYFFSYTFIPLSAIAFPHILIFCLTAEKMNHFKKTVIFYPLCILAIWLPCVFLGVMANRVTDIPQIKARQEARRVLATQGKTMAPEARDELREQAAGDDVIMLLLQRYAPLWLAGLLGRRHHGGGHGERFADPGALDDVHGGCVCLLWGQETIRRSCASTYRTDLHCANHHCRLRGRARELRRRSSSWQYSMPSQVSRRFHLCWLRRCSGRKHEVGRVSGDVMDGSVGSCSCCFSARRTRACTRTTTAGRLVTIGGTEALSRTPGGTAVFGFMPVVPMVLMSSLLMLVVSLLTRKPKQSTIAKYFRFRKKFAADLRGRTRIRRKQQQLRNDEERIPGFIVALSADPEFRCCFFLSAFVRVNPRPNFLSSAEAIEPSVL